MGSTPRLDVQRELTREGWLVGLGAPSLVVLGAFAGNNVLVGMGCWLLCLFVGVWWAGRRQIRRLQVRRLLPAELFAGVMAPGAFEVDRSDGAAVRDVLVEELGGQASGWVVEEQAPATASARWLIAARGTWCLQGVRVSSPWPLGWIRWSLEIDSPVDVVVWPNPAAAEAGLQNTRAAGQDLPGGVGREGDLRGLREYGPGDRASALHSVTWARTGVPMVLQRTGEQQAAICVQVPEESGQAWERALEEACGAVLTATARGQAVGLSLPGGDASLAQPRSGGAWRRALLDALAEAS